LKLRNIIFDCFLVPFQPIIAPVTV
jgi:hypothetical protein